MARPETSIAPSAVPAEASPRRIAAEFRRLLANGARLAPAGEARSDPALLLRRGYGPRFRLDLFDTRFYLAPVRQNPAIRFFVAYVVPGNGHRGRVYPRIFYKDISLVWRAASHLIATDSEFWIGKGDVRTVCENGEEITQSVESTTDLPLELQDALEDLNHRTTHVAEDEAVLYLVLRSAPDGRVRPYRDFLEPRQNTMERDGFRINGGRPVARFTRPGDPTSLRFARGFEPDLDDGVLECSESTSKLYGGRLQRFRILSTNRRIQYLFFAGPRHVWIVPPQATTTELSSFGLRTVDVHADEDLFVPGYEYHYYEDDGDPASLVSQIPEGFAGPVNAMDPDRADASPWIERLPIIRAFRRKVLRRKAPRLLKPD